MLYTDCKLNTSLNLAWSKGWVRVVYQYSGKTFRYPIAKLPEECFKRKGKIIKYNISWFNGSPSEWSKFAVALQKDVDLLYDVLNEISPNIDPSKTIKKSDIDNALARKKNDVREGVDCHGSLIVDFKKYMTEGAGSKKIYETRKDYWSALHMLEDFEYDYGSVISYSDLDMDLIEEIADYAYAPRVSTEEHSYETKGELSNKTLNKRFDVLWTFIKDYYGIMPNGLERKPRFEEGEHKIIRLDLGEINELYKLTIEDKSLEFARDCLVFLCLTGLRFSDLQAMDYSWYQPEFNELVFKTHKTGKTCHVYMFDQALALARKYNFHFAPKWNVTLNRDIKRLLEKYDLFSETISLDIMGKTRRTIQKKKRELISCHTGRRSFVSMCMEMGLNCDDVMAATGHASTKMLYRYYDIFGKGRRSRFKELNEKIKYNDNSIDNK